VDSAEETMGTDAAMKAAMMFDLNYKLATTPLSDLRSVLHKFVEDFVGQAFLISDLKMKLKAIEHELEAIKTAIREQAAVKSEGIEGGQSSHGSTDTHS